METITFIATLLDNNHIDIDFCNVIPDFVHAVKYDHINNLEIYFSADDNWTPELENQALKLSTFAYDVNSVAV